jgi:FkbM family methyltransferase
VYALIIFSEE